MEVTLPKGFREVKRDKKGDFVNPPQPIWVEAQQVVNYNFRNYNVGDRLQWTAGIILLEETRNLPESSRIWFEEPFPDQVYRRLDESEVTEHLARASSPARAADAVGVGELRESVQSLENEIDELKEAIRSGIESGELNVGNGSDPNALSALSNRVGSLETAISTVNNELSTIKASIEELKSFAQALADELNVPPETRLP